MAEMVHEKVMLTAQEVADILGVTLSMAYKIIKNCNNELAAKGKLTIAGRVNRRYLMEKIEV